MKNKRLLLLGLLLATVMLVAACAPKETPATPAPATEVPATAEPAAQTPEALSLTLEELAKFNGKDGQPAYIAVDGVVYDVTNSAAWKDGAHNGFEAGKDLTTEIKEQSPHGVGKLDNVVEVGKLVP